ncbi:hypothetical protein EUA93_19340 [Nocardioides oleivorans]|uniref:Uncharacterized protein n=1 Tax=Nocardioides oleivorans TaxID=273676 RepID=A0A4Q2RUF8_9ACTN|nr:hypothetical protein [Nocardioides oleivorans]RYB91083.1 hypothetical protein EUA93_19340 [Nocardioides oleivorans]
MNRSPVLTAVVVLAWSLVGLPPATAEAPSGSTVTFTSETEYVVSTTVGRHEVEGTGQLPAGFTSSGVRARPASNGLGSVAVEVLVDFGHPVYSMSARGYALFTHRTGKLRPVTLEGRPVVLSAFAEDSGQGGFRCEDGRLLVHRFDLSSRRGEQTTYRLVGTRLKKVSRVPLRRSVASRPGSCA